MSHNISQIADYFVVVGLPEHPESVEDYSGPESPTKRAADCVDPITDVAVIFKGLGDPVPKEFECILETPSGHSANLNSGSFRAPEVYICIRRGRDKPALTDMGVMQEGARLMENAAAVFLTPTGRIANINNTASPNLYVTYTRAPPNATPDTLVVMDICVVITSKGEEPPHTFCKIAQKLNTGLVGAEIYLCYRKGRLRDKVLSFKPEVLSRYPLNDTAAPYPLNTNIPMFCLPLGAAIELWPAAARHPPPVFSSFVITHGNESSENADDAFIQYYGCVITFYESHQLEKLSTTQANRLGLQQNVPLRDQGKSLVSLKAICLLSQYAFFEEFKQYLTHIYRLSSLENNRLPIERFISHLLHEVPVPSAERPRILVQLSPEESIMFTRPEDLPLPPSCASFTSLLNDLGVEKTLDVFLYALLGENMLVHSVRPWLLTLACEAIKTMIFPFIWSFPFIPFCPLALSEIVHCPTGFIIGVDTSYFDLYDPPPEVICIDLDTGSIKLPEHKKQFTAKLLPKKPLQQLQQRLEKVHRTLQRTSLFFTEFVDVNGDISHERAEMKRQRQTALELECREAFLVFMATILRGYHAFLVVPTNVKTKTNLDVDSLFRIRDFVRTREKSLAKFFDTINLGGLQNFAKFVEELTFSSKPQVFDFFNDCCQKVDEMLTNSAAGHAVKSQRLIETSRDVDNERTVVVPPPSSHGLEESRTYSYQHFPVLDQSLFLKMPVLNMTPSRIAQNGELKSPTEAQSLDAGQKTQTSSMPNRSGRQTFDWSIIKRTRQEIKSSQQFIQQKSSIPYEWAKIIEAQCYSVWFCNLPAFCRLVHSRKKLLLYAVTLARNGARFGDALGSDQMPYRVIFAMADFYRHPAIAVQLLMRIRKLNFEPNAATLALANKVLYQTSWQTESQSRPARLWRLLRDVVSAVAQFRAAGVRFRSKSHQSLVSISQTSSDQQFTLQPILVTQNSLQLANESFSKADQPAALIYSPLAKSSQHYFKFPDAPLAMNNQPLGSTASRRPPECNESQSSLNTTSQAGDAPQSPMQVNSLQNTFTSPYVREKAGKVFDFFSKVATQAAQHPVGQAGRRLVESQSSQVISGSSEQLANQIPTPPNINVTSPGLDNSGSELIPADVVQNRTALSSDSASSAGISGGLFKRILSKTVQPGTESPQHDSASLSSLKESRSTPQFLFSSAQKQFSTGFSQVRSKLSSAVAQIAAATSVAPDDSLIDLHTEQSMTGSVSGSQMMSAFGGVFSSPQPNYQQPAQVYRQHSVSSLSVRSQEGADQPVGGYGSRSGAQQQPDLQSVGSQVTSDSATNDSYSRSNQNNPKYQHNSANAKVNRTFSGAVVSSTGAASSSHNRSTNQLEEPILHPDYVNAAGSEDGAVAAGPFGPDMTFDDLDFWPLPPVKDEALVQIMLCAANKCPSPKCGQILFEEDIMAMWSASDSVFNAVCPMCGVRFIPKLEIYVKDFRKLPDSRLTNGDSEHIEDHSDNATGSISSAHRPQLKRSTSEILTKTSASELGRFDICDLDPISNVEISKERQPERLVGPISCLFLSPLALRKEIEQATERNMHSTSLFADGSFVDNHDTLYWNLLFVNARMQFHSHLGALVIFSRLLRRDEPSGKQLPNGHSDHHHHNGQHHKKPSVAELRDAASQVAVQIVWDNLQLYSVTERPLYWHWAVDFGRSHPVVNALVDFRPFSRRLMTKLLTAVRKTEILNAIKLILLIRRRGLPNERFFRDQSMYRLLLNLCIVVMGRYNIDIKAFDNEYHKIYNQIKATSAASIAASRALGKSPLALEMRPFDAPPSEAAIYCRRAHHHADIYADFEQKPTFLLPILANREAKRAQLQKSTVAPPAPDAVQMAGSGDNAARS